RCVYETESQQGGGPLIDIGTHALDITLWMMDNYEPESVNGSVFHKLGSLPGADEGNMFGPWDTENFEVEDSAFGFIKMKDGATIFLESSWALNVLES
ncbi:gfo/Idh/MocA family oxidoreductase, partial [Enterococcus sp. S181_ASV_20]|nr:gfo/Idh/MocA family oxidoreductase [Enterococcus sp. S181_ASV_20]